jgi:hypothetical protein
MQVQIRGATSILGQGDPLYVIDGVIVSNARCRAVLAAISRSIGIVGRRARTNVNRSPTSIRTTSRISKF